MDTNQILKSAEDTKYPMKKDFLQNSYKGIASILGKYVERTTLYTEESVDLEELRKALEEVQSTTKIVLYEFESGIGGFYAIYLKEETPEDVVHWIKTVVKSLLDIGVSALGSPESEIFLDTDFYELENFV